VDDPIGAAALNLAGWHRSSLLALGIVSSEDGVTWWTDRTPPPIYHSVIMLEGPHAAEAHRERVARVAATGPGAMSVCDSWDALDLSDLGFRPMGAEAWFVRPPGPPPSLPGSLALEILEVRDEEGLVMFEQTSIEGFESPGLHALGRLGLHASGILGDGAMRAFLGRADGRPVAAAMGFESHGVIGVYGVTTLPGYRRRGYGRAMTVRVVGIRHDLPAVLQAGEPAGEVYRSLGFAEAGRFRNWVRPGPASG
jgi:GNAT superfamily N-acetyltransferase